MKFGKSLVLLLLILFAVGVMPRAAAAEDKSTNSRLSVILPPVMKLSRGIANVAFSPLELPISWNEVNNDQGGIAGITYGTLKGIGCIFARIGVGIVDIVTFPFPLPNCPDDPEGYGSGYGPILTPAWVIDVNHDWQNFVFSNEAIIVDQN